MDFVGGLLLVLLSGAAFVYSLPREGKTARFVGTEWEGYAVVLMIGAGGQSEGNISIRFFFFGRSEPITC